MDTIITGYIAKIIDESTVIITVGKKDGVSQGMKFIIYEEGDTIINPITKEPLEKLDIIKGEILINQIQESISIGATKHIEKISDDKMPVLSELMLKASLETTSGQHEREKLYVNKSQISGRYNIKPVAVGDKVKSVL